MAKEGIGMLLGVAALLIIYTITRKPKLSGKSNQTNINTIFGLQRTPAFTSNAPPTNPMFSSIPTPGSNKAPHSWLNNISLGLK